MKNRYNFSIYALCDVKAKNMHGVLNALTEAVKHYSSNSKALFSQIHKSSYTEVFFPKKDTLVIFVNLNEIFLSAVTLEEPVFFSEEHPYIRSAFLISCRLSDEQKLKEAFVAAPFDPADAKDERSLINIISSFIN